MPDVLARLRPYTLTTAAAETSRCGLNSLRVSGGDGDVATVDASGVYRYRLTLPGDTDIDLADGSEVTIDAFPGRRFRVEGPPEASNLRLNGFPLSVAYIVVEDR